MNKIYKVVKNRSTGCDVAVSELAKSITRGRMLKVSVLPLLLFLFNNANATTSVPIEVKPGSSTSHVHGIETITTSDILDLGIGNGLRSIYKGEEVKKYILNSVDTIDSLYQTKYTDVTNATNAYNSVRDSFNQGISTQTDLDNAKAALDLAKEKSAAIDDSKFKVTDSNNLISSQSEGVTISEKTLIYRDAVTDKAFTINVIDDLVKTQAGASTVSGGGISVEFHEKTDYTDQYDDTQVFDITGSSTDITIVNNGSDTNNSTLIAIAKNGSGLVNVHDGANITLDTDISYYSGGSDSKSTAFEEKDEYSNNASTTLYKVTYKGTVNTALGTKTITSEQEFNEFNSQLIDFIKTNEQLRLDYSTAEAMQEFYDKQIAGLYTVTTLGSYDVQYTLTKDELAQLAKDNGLENEFNNRVTEDDRGTDIGLDSADNNYLVGVQGSGSVITVNEGKKVINSAEDDGKTKVSAGAIIRADFDDSGKDENNTFNINGTLDANSGRAIIAKNAEVNVSNKGKIVGDIIIKESDKVDGNIVNNLGIISGDVNIANGKIDNSGTGIIGSITSQDNVIFNNTDSAKVNNNVKLGNNSQVNNDSTIGANVTVGTDSEITNNAGAIIGGGVLAKEGSTVINQDEAIIEGVVDVDGLGASFKNNGVAGGAKASNGAVVTNNNLIANDGSIELYSKSTFTNDGDIYIGYVYDKSSNDVNTDVANSNAYAAMTVSDVGTQLVNKKNIYVSGNQHDVNVVSVTNGAEFIHNSSSIIELNQDALTISNVSKDTGNNNVAVSVSGAGSTASIAGSILLNDTGNTGLFVKDQGLITLTGTVDLNGEKVNGSAVRSFGAWVQGDGSQLVITDNAQINMNAERAIGVHVRDGATAEINGHAGITFSNLADQIGFLISGISAQASLIYNSDQELKLQGDGSVLFRVERGSKFDSETISSTTNALSVLDSNGTKGSTLMVVTTGGVASGSNKKTEANLGGFTLKVSGEEAKGISVEGGATASITDDTTVKLTGDGAILGNIDGWYYDLNGIHNSSYDGKSQLTSSANLTTDLTAASGVVSGENSVGYYISHGGELVHEGSIFFDAPSKNNIGVKIDTGGTLTSEAGSFIKVYGTAVEISGESSAVNVKNEANGDAPVIWAVGTTTNDSAYHIKDMAGITLTGAGVTKAEGTAHGILVDGAAQVTLDGATLDLYGDDIQSSSGNGIENRSALTTILLKNKATINVKDGYGIHSSVGFSTNNTDTSGIINVYGSGTGIRFEGINSVTGAITGTSTNTFINQGYKNLVVNVYEETGHGIYTNSYGEINLSTSVNIISQTGQSALEIKGLTQKAAQSGNYHSANKNAVIVDLNNGYVNTFTNNGELLFGDFAKDTNDTYVFTASDRVTAATGNAIATNASEKGLNFTNGASGKINGTVELLGYGDSTSPSDKTKGNIVTLVGGSEGNVFRTGKGDDTFVLSTVTGNDIVGDEHQVKEFSKLDGGEGSNDSVVFDNGSDFTITNDATIININKITVQGESEVTLDNLTTTDGLNSGVDTYTINRSANGNKIILDSRLTYKWAKSNTSFNKILAGNGTFRVDLGASGTKPTNDFAFDGSTNTGSFNGTLELTNTNFTLNNDDDHKNADALTNATLKASDNSYVFVEGKQTIGGLYFNGGTVNFGQGELGKISDEPKDTDNFIKVTDLTLEKGNVQIDLSNYDNSYNPNIPTTLELLDQDSANMMAQLVESEHRVIGGAANLTLIDKDGYEIGDKQTSDIQNGDARATYGIHFTTGEDDDGLYLGYGLTQVELKTKDGDADGSPLILDATKSHTADFDVLIIDYDNGDGTKTYGDLQITGTRAITLKGNNTYHGSTYVRENAGLISVNDNALGYTRLLELERNATFKLNGHAQSVGSLITADGSLISLLENDTRTSILTITGVDGTVKEGTQTKGLVTEIAGGTLAGGGQLNIGDGLQKFTVQATVNGDNDDLAAAVLNAINGQIDLKSQGGLGTGALTNNGTLNLDFAADSTLTNTSLVGNGIINKFDENALTFTVEQAEKYAGTINVNNGAMIFNGNSDGDSYKASAINVASGATIAGVDNASFNGTVNNSGTFYIGEMPNNTTTVSNQTVTVGNYNGTEGSLLVFNGVLAGDDSTIDKLIITGNSSGASYVKVNNIGGLGAKTIDGISIIDVNGASDGEFVQSGRIVGGAYTYSLVRSSSNSNNWVLKNSGNDDPDNVRPDFGSYIGNMYTANSLFNTRLHDRLGETQYTDLFTGEQKVTSMWMRHQYGYNKLRASNGRLAVKDNWNVSQLGGDIAQWSTDGLNRLHLGVMVGQGHSSTNSKSRVDHAKSKGTLNGYSYGIYATWYDNEVDKTGLYVDTWALWNRFSASVKSEGLKERYTLKGLTASVESGYTFLTGSLGNYDVWLQPKGQAIWGGVKTHGLTEDNGTRLGFNDGNVQTRLGVRVSLLSNAELQAQTNQAGQLFMEANWLHNTKLYNVKVNEEQTIGQDGARNIGELKVGVEGYVTKNANIWFNLAGQRGDHNYENASVMLGLKYSF